MASQNYELEQLIAQGQRPPTRDDAFAGMIHSNIVYGASW